MAKFNVDGAQNVEVSIKLPCQKPPKVQLQIMKDYTQKHKELENAPREIREVECLSVLYPTLFREIEPEDRIIGRLDFLPIGFGCVTSVGGVGHYCVFNKLKQFRETLSTESEKQEVDALYAYWLENDLKTKYCNDVLTDDTIGRFVDCSFPLIATARLSGMMLDYQKLMDLGIGGLAAQIEAKLQSDPDNSFYKGALASLGLFVRCADALRDMARRHKAGADAKRQQQLDLIIESLGVIRHDKPQTFHQALQLFWLYALLAGVINYGRLDDYLGPFLQADLAAGRITEDDAYDYLKSLWTMIENRRTTVNGRIIVGGRGRKHPQGADIFIKIAMRVARDLRYVEPQFTLRLDKNTPDDVFAEALDIIGQGATYPTLYNDDVNIPAVMRAMNVDEKTAEQYVPFGCGEFVIAGQSTGTPNTCLNLLKLLQIAMNNGIDPADGIYKAGPLQLKPLGELQTYEELWEQYTKVLDYYFDLSVRAQAYSYEVMNREVSFLFTSILMDDCIARGKALLDGGVRYLGGTNETYGNINTSDALTAIKQLVYEQKRYTLEELNTAALCNFKGHEVLRKELWECDKYGNDLDTADSIADTLFCYVANGIRDRGLQHGMAYYLIVISNNQLNTEWGRTTAASLDGRYAGQYMNPANNPQGGANQSGPTAMLNSLAKFDAGLHGGSVQNIKFSKAFFNENLPLIQTLFRTYFQKGGCQVMVTVVDKGVLEDAVVHPELYPDLIVRVSGFSAVFVNLEPDIQAELLSRVMYG